MNMIQFSHGIMVESGNTQNRLPPAPSFNPTPEQLPGVQETPTETEKAATETTSTEKVEEVAPETPNENSEVKA